MKSAAAKYMALTAILILSITGVVVAELPTGKFINPEPVAGINFDVELYPMISPNGLELYFQSNDGGNQDIWVATRTAPDVPFENVALLAGINSPSEDGPGSLSADGLTFYFGSQRSGLFDLFQASRVDLNSPFENVTSLGSGVNTNRLENLPAISSDGLELFYHSSSAPGSTDHRLWTATRDDPNGMFDNAMDLGAIVNGEPTIDSWKPSISADGLTLFFSDGFFGAPRPGGKGDVDIWVAHRQSPSDDFGPPMNLDDIWPGSEVNTASTEGLAFISADWPAVGSKLYYMRPGTGTGDIWEATWAPEPSTALLLSIATICMAARARRVQFRGELFEGNA